jgi:hypothetical protein
VIPLQMWLAALAWLEAEQRDVMPSFAKRIAS